ncbi:MAG TPA: C-terminal helicase domain-containing protein, partial [Balneolales bacterium]|nr:C-terminal helicase domain-containing protein [Balneolales bacterium]
LARILRDNGFKAEAYHAGLPAAKRQQIQKNWLDDNLTWVVSTNAFGMGIDKKDCRYVFHYMIPSSMEAYYQEAGRAGRDGEPAFPILLYKDSDYRRIRGLIEHSYPGKEELNRIYSALCDSFDIAVGSDMEEADQVDLHNLAHRSELSEKRILAGLRVLNQLGLIELISNYQPEMGIRFLIGQDSILDFISNTHNVAKSEFIDHLFRLFGPESLHQRIFLKVDYLRDKMGISKNKLLKGLTVLQREQILQFEDRANNPLVFLTDPRQERLPYTAQQLEWYRNILLQKLNAVQGYANTRECRSRYIRIYFGETDVPRFCGKCDNCLNLLEKDSDIKAENVRHCYGLISNSPSTSEDLVKYSGFSPALVKHILKILLREELITDSADDPGVFRISR